MAPILTLRLMVVFALVYHLIKIWYSVAIGTVGQPIDQRGTQPNRMMGTAIWHGLH